MKAKIIVSVVAVVIFIGALFFYLNLRKMTNASVHFSVKGTENIIIKRDVVYTDKSEDLNTLDIYLPKGYDSKNQYPAVLFVS